MFYKIMLLRKETVHPDFAEATEDSRMAFHCRRQVRSVLWEGSHGDAMMPREKAQRNRVRGRKIQGRQEV